MEKKYRKMSNQELLSIRETCTEVEKRKIQKELERRIKRNNANWINWLMVVEIVFAVLAAVVALVYKVAVVKFLMGL